MLDATVAIGAETHGTRTMRVRRRRGCPCPCLLGTATYNVLIGMGCQTTVLNDILVYVCPTVGLFISNTKWPLPTYSTRCRDETCL